MSQTQNVLQTVSSASVTRSQRDMFSTSAREGNLAVFVLIKKDWACFRCLHRGMKQAQPPNYAKKLCGFANQSETKR